MTVLAQEELGKFAWLSTASAYALANDKSRETWERFWNAFSDHTSKYVETIGLDYRYVLGTDIRYAIEDTGDVNPLPTEEKIAGMTPAQIMQWLGHKRTPRAKIPKAADILKQAGFYMDFLEVGRSKGFVTPEASFRGTSRFVRRYIRFTRMKLDVLRTAWNDASKTAGQSRASLPEIRISQTRSYRAMRAYLVKMENAMAKRPQSGRARRMKGKH